MKKVILSLLSITSFLLVVGTAFSQTYIADYSAAKEEVIRSIPIEYINKARTELVIAYQHSSHGTHVSRGVFGLQDYKPGDDTIFGVSLTPFGGRLEFRDNALESYAPPGIDATDLSQNETAFIQTTRNYLDAPENAMVNVIMWSWCSISYHDVAGNYLPGMDSLISEYGLGGSKIGTGPGQRELPVTFIYMTGHASYNNTGDQMPKPQADLITTHCNTFHQFCLDYYSIDTHDMDDNYWEDANDDGHSSEYGGNFYMDWQNTHTLGEHWFENKRTPGGIVDFGEHNTQHITANRKGYALWWILARIAGWQESRSFYVSETGSDETGDGTELNPFRNIAYAVDQAIDGDTICILPGTYNEFIEYSDKDLVITSEFLTTADLSSVENTTVFGDINEPVFSITNSQNSEIIGLSITNGLTAINCINSTAIIRNNRISGNDLAGIAASEGSNLHIYNNLIYKNNNLGIVFADFSDGEIVNNTIYGNALAPVEGAPTAAIMCVDEANPTIKNNILMNNGAFGIWATNDTPIISYNCVFGYETAAYFNSTSLAGELEEDPLFVNPFGDDFRLHWAPPASTPAIQI